MLPILSMKKIIASLYIVLLIVMAAATITETYTSTPFVQQHFYGSWWFIVLWGLLVPCGIAYILKRRLRKWNLLLLHCSFVVILLGALLTHLTSYRGMVHLRGEQPTNKYSEMVSMTKADVHDLPFYLRLDKFQQVNHAGTDAAADYITYFTIIDGNNKYKGVVSMNNIAKYHGVRFYQASYDSDRLGSYLQVNSDRYGIPVTYTGYGFLFFSLFWLLVDPKGEFRKLASQMKSIPNLCVGLLLGFMGLFVSVQSTSAQNVMPQETAQRFGNLLINYNERICPVETFALDFTDKIYGKRNYKGYTASQVLMSWIFFPQYWNNEPFIHVKNKTMRERFGLPDYASVNAFFRTDGYILGAAVLEYNDGQKDAFHKACADIDGKLQIIMSLRQGTPLSIFPYTYHDGTTQWFSPFEKYPKRLPKDEIVFIKNVFPLLYAAVSQGDYATATEVLDKIGEYQQRQGGSSIPSTIRLKAEHIYNAFPLATILFMVNLTLGIVGLVLVYLRLTGNATGRKRVVAGVMPFLCFDILLLLSFLALTFQLSLRWMITGTVPLGNGYETTLAVAWMTMLFGLLMIVMTRRANGLFTSFAFLLSGFFLLVSHLSMMDPAMGPLMPVLNSPLLTIHVSFMMMSYALLGLTFISSVMALLTPHLAVHLQTLSRLMLYPAIVTLGIGIFLGAIWANISWGTYWSWDPKETWALITFLVYAIALHTKSVPALSRPRNYHLFILCAFATIVITYFGVNYLMSGMHSYA